MQHVEIDSSLNKLLKKCAYIGILNKLQEENKLTEEECNQIKEKLKIKWVN